MRRMHFLALFAVTLAAAAALRAGSSPDLGANGKPTAPSAGLRAIIPQVADRGNTRMIWFPTVSGSGQPINESAILTASTEIDVTAATMHVETGSSAGYFGTGIVVSQASLSSQTTYPIQFAFSGHGTQHLTFDPPVRLRSGDTVYVSTSTTATGLARVEMSLFGYQPAATRENGMMAR